MRPNLDKNGPRCEDAVKVSRAEYSPDKLNRALALRRKRGKSNIDWCAMFAKAQFVNNDRLRAVLGRHLQEQTSEVTGEQQVAAVILEGEEEGGREDDEQETERLPPGGSGQEAPAR